jgi:acetyl-CoA C-acetyltransferase
MTMDRQCSSGLMTIATAAKQVIVDRMDVIVAGGGRVDLAGPDAGAAGTDQDPELVKLHADAYMSMLDTAETVARRYGISREVCDEYALQSQQRAAAAQADGRLDAEIVPMTTTMLVTTRPPARSRTARSPWKDEGNRADTTLEGLRR